MTDLAAFLLARIDEDEHDAHRAEAAADGPLWVVTGPDNAVGVDYDPARVLADCAARRALIAAVEDDPFDAMGAESHYEWIVLQHLAQPYRAHPDFDPAWALNEEST